MGHCLTSLTRESSCKFLEALQLLSSMIRFLCCLLEDCFCNEKEILSDFLVHCTIHSMFFVTVTSGNKERILSPLQMYTVSHLNFAIYVRFAILLHLQIELCVVVSHQYIWLCCTIMTSLKQSRNYQVNNYPRQVFHSVFQQWLLP